LDGNCQYIPEIPLRALTATQHLSCFLRICFQHISSNVHGLKPYVDGKVAAAMMSLNSAHELSNFEGTLNIIWDGGKKAVGEYYIDK